MMTYIEFFGLPGTGKTTICSALIERLQTDKYIYGDIFTYQDAKNVSSSFFFRFGPHFKLLRYIYKFTKLNGGKSLSKRTIAVWINAIKVASFCKYGNDDSILILDQSFLQDILSILHSNRIKNIDSLSKLILYYYSLINNPVIVSTKLDFAINKDRIQKRVTNQSRADHMEEDELIEYLSTQNVNIQEIMHIITEKKIIVDTIKTIDENVELIRTYCFG